MKDYLVEVSVTLQNFNSKGKDAPVNIFYDYF